MKKKLTQTTELNLPVMVTRIKTFSEHHPPYISVGGKHNFLKDQVLCDKFCKANLMVSKTKNSQQVSVI